MPTTTQKKPIKIGKKVKFFKFSVLCVDGGYGWGRTGQKASMCFNVKTRKEAEDKLKQQIPGGWTYKFLKETEDTYYLRHENGNIKT